jgi:hypothetical protein
LPTAPPIKSPSTSDPTLPSITTGPHPAASSSSTKKSPSRQAEKNLFVKFWEFFKP